MNLGEVKTQFLALLNNTRCTPTLVTAFIDAGLGRCQRELRCPAMEKSLQITIGSDYDGLWIPGDYLAFIRLENSYGRKLVRKSLDYVKARAAEGVGTPQFYARQNKQFIIGPLPAEGDTLRLDYYAEFEAVSADTDENLLTLISPYLLIYSALCFASDYFTDVRAERFEGRYVQILGQLNQQTKDDEIIDASVQPEFGFLEDW